MVLEKFLVKLLDPSITCESESLYWSGSGSVSEKNGSKSVPKYSLISCYGAIKTWPKFVIQENYSYYNSFIYIFKKRETIDGRIFETLPRQLCADSAEKRWKIPSWPPYYGSSSLNMAIFLLHGTAGPPSRFWLVGFSFPRFPLAAENSGCFWNIKTAEYPEKWSRPYTIKIDSFVERFTI